MFNLLKFKVAAISLSIGVLLVGFQNCSKIKIDSEDVAGLNNGLNTDVLPDGSSNEINQPPVGSNPPSGGGSVQPPTAEQPAPGMQPIPPVVQPPMPPNGGNPPVVQPSPPVIQPPMTPEDKECVEWALDKKKSHDDNSSDDNDNSGVAGVACNKDKEVMQMPKCSVNSDEDDDDEDYEGTCAEAKIKFKSSSIRTQNFVHFRGSYVLTKESLGSSSLDEIRDFRGKLIICDVDVEKIDDTRGKIVVVNSRVGSFTNHRGKAVLINSSIDECSDIKGKLVIEGGTAVCRNVSSTLGRIDIKRSK